MPAADAATLQAIVKDVQMTQAVMAQLQQQVRALHSNIKQETENAAVAIEERLRQSLAPARAAATAASGRPSSGFSLKKALVWGMALGIVGFLVYYYINVYRHR